MRACSPSATTSSRDRPAFPRTTGDGRRAPSSHGRSPAALRMGGRVPAARSMRPARRAGSARATVHGWAKDVMEDGDPGAYVSQGAGLQYELFFERGVILRPGESFELDLARAPSTPRSSTSSSPRSRAARLTTRRSRRARSPASACRCRSARQLRVRGTHRALREAEARRRRALRQVRPARAARAPSRERSAIRVSIVNRGKTQALARLAARHEARRGPRTAAGHHRRPRRSALPRGGGVPVRRDARREGGLGARGRRRSRRVLPCRPVVRGRARVTSSVRFFTGAYYAGAMGWPGMFGKGFDETLMPVQPGPVARAAEQGFVTAFIGNNFTVLPNFGNIGWDVGFNSEMKEHPAAMARIVERLGTRAPARRRADRLVECRRPTAPARPSAAARRPRCRPVSPTSEIDKRPLKGSWREPPRRSGSLQGGLRRPARRRPPTRRA